MNSNNMEQVAQCLGVTLGKPFYIEGRSYSFILTKSGLYKMVSGIQSKVNNDTLELLLMGSLKVDSRFLPDQDEAYYFPNLTGVEIRHWQNSDEDRYYYDNFLVFDDFGKAKEVLAIMLNAVKEYTNANKKVKGHTQNAIRRN